MALFNYANREITAKIVYYGPGVCGKTTSLQYIHERIAPVQRGRLLSLATETDRTIFFDLLPLKLGEIRGFKLRFQLYTVPGQVKYNKTRKLVLQGADALVFVADSQVNRREKNIESFRNLQENLQEQGKRLDDLPLVYAYNKRDLDNILTIDQLNKDLNPKNLPYFPAVATKGVGVMETLEAISKTALLDIEKRLMATTSTTEPTQVEEEFSLTDDELLDLTVQEEALDTGSLSLSDDLESLELESDLDLSAGEETEPLESRPIGYDNTIQVEEFEIPTETVAQTGTLKESEFFDLKEIEEQALRELDEFIEGNLEEGDFEAGDEVLSFDALGSDRPGAGLDEADSQDSEEDLFGTSPESEASFDFSFADSDASLDEEPDEGLDFSFSADISGQEPEEDTGLDFSFSAGDGGDSADEVEQHEPEVEEAGSSAVEPDSLLDFTLGNEPHEKEPQPFESLGEAGGVEPLELSEDELDFSRDDQELADLDTGLDLSFGTEESPEAGTDFPSFTLPDDAAGDERGESTSLTGEGDDLVEFTLDDDLEATPAEAPPDESSTALGDIESLNLSDEDLDLSFGEEEEDEGPALLAGADSPDAESGPPYDFRITDSVRFEMQHSEEISSVTPFEKQLDKLSEDMFTAEEEPPDEGFEPETVPETDEEQFQALVDESKRQLVLARYFYQQGEIARAKQKTSAHIQATLMYYLAVETALKAVALKYETCNPAVASLKIILDSIEEETEKTISGRTSVMDNIVALKDQIQMETCYPDQDACELAARICDRFLSTLAEEFLSLDINELSPILPEPVER